jgi:hypothetical protein
MNTDELEENLKQMAKELHKPVNKKFERRHIISNKVNDIWSADLVDMSALSKKNNGYKYMLNVIDVFSRYAWIKPLKDKSAKTVLRAFEDIIADEKTTPKKLWVDQGSEFYNKDFLQFLKKYGIKIYSTFSEHKASVIERFNKTIKTMMYRDIFTAKQTRNWIADIDDLLEVYNMRKHSSLGMTPFQAYNLDKEEQKTLWTKQMSKPYVGKQKKPKFKVGDSVRISRVKGKFEKGYDENWSKEIFKITSVSKTYPFMYKIKDYNDEAVKGGFYENELQKTALEDFFLVEKILQTKIIKGKKKAFVKWVGYDDKFNSWIDYDQAIDLAE